VMTRGRRVAITFTLVLTTAILAALCTL